MKRAEGIAYLTQCSDRDGRHYYAGVPYSAEDCLTCRGTNRAGHLATFSRYGRTSRDVAPIAWRLAYLVARETGEVIDYDALDHAMSLVVNDHDDVGYMICTYGQGWYGR